MIVFDLKDFKIINPEDLLNGFNEESLHKIRDLEINQRLKFVVPERIKENQDKTIYKSGFLCVFLQLLYPNEKMSKIYSILNSRYDVFLSSRQIIRNRKKYLDKAFYKNQEKEGN